MTATIQSRNDLYFVKVNVSKRNSISNYVQVGEGSGIPLMEINPYPVQCQWWGMIEQNTRNTGKVFISGSDDSVVETSSNYLAFWDLV